MKSEEIREKIEALGAGYLRVANDVAALQRSYRKLMDQAEKLEEGIDFLESEYVDVKGDEDADSDDPLEIQGSFFERLGDDVPLDISDETLKIYSEKQIEIRVKRAWKYFLKGE